MSAPSMSQNPAPPEYDQWYTESADFRVLCLQDPLLHTAVRNNVPVLDLIIALCDRHAKTVETVNKIYENTKCT